MKRKELNHFIISRWDPDDPSGNLTKIFSGYEFVITEVDKELGIHSIKLRPHFLDIWFVSVFYNMSYRLFIRDPYKARYPMGDLMRYYTMTVIPSRFCLCDNEYLQVVLKDMGIQDEWIIHQLDT